MLMKCKFIVIAIPTIYKAATFPTSFFFFVWYVRRNQYPHPIVLNILQQVAHEEKSPDCRPQSDLVSAVFVNLRKNNHLCF